MVRNRFCSDVNGERPRRWLRNLSDYSAGPLDRFNRVIDTRPRFSEGIRHTEADYVA